MSKTAGVVVGLALLVTGAAFALWPRSGSAEDPPYELRFLSISGESSTTKAWYEGAPPSGVKVQEALDKFTQLGFRLAGQAPAWRQSQVTVTASTSPGSTTSADPAWILFLEKGRK